MINKSTGARAIPGILLKTKPEPNIYRCPLSKIISPIYMRSVITEAVIEGIQMETNFRFSKRNEPTNTPMVTPKRMKKTAINVADKGDT